MLFLLSQAQAEVCKMMEGDVIPKFVVSEEHQLMIQFMRGTGGEPPARLIPQLKQRLSNMQRGVLPDIPPAS